MTVQIIAWIFIGLWMLFSGIVYWKEDFDRDIFSAILAGAFFTVAFIILTPFVILLFAAAFGVFI